MTTPLPETPIARESVKPTREQALAIAERRMAARRRRTRGIRRVVAVVAIAAFAGPFGLLYTQLAAGGDPALSNNATVTTASTTAHGAVQPAILAPAAVTTQQS
jgi:hypothetical protein